MSWGKKICKIKKSLPIRGVWIEIPSMRGKVPDTIVAPHTGSVD